MGALSCLPWIVRRDPDGGRLHQAFTGATVSAGRSGTPAEKIPVAKERAEGRAKAGGVPACCGPSDFSKSVPSGVPLVAIGGAKCGGPF